MHAPTPADLDALRPALTAHCYRMLGSPMEAEDAVQETLIRAWRNLARFEGRSSLRTWTTKIATRVCLDALDGRKRRAIPMDMGPARTGAGPLGEALPAEAFVIPMPDAWVVPADGSPDERLLAREGIRLAFVTALQHLPPLQRAVLILREVLDWSAAEVAEALETSVAAVNSALQRARATLTAVQAGRVPPRPPAEIAASISARFVDAFERYDMDALTALLHDDAVLSMPPYDLWMRGHAHITAWMTGPGIACQNSRLIPTAASGELAFGQYKPGPDGQLVPWSLIVLDMDVNGVRALTHFLDTPTLFPRFGLPDHLPAEDASGVSSR